MWATDHPHKPNLLLSHLDLLVINSRYVVSENSDQGTSNKFIVRGIVTTLSMEYVSR